MAKCTLRQWLFEDTKDCHCLSVMGVDRFNVLVSFTSANGFNIWNINGIRQGIKPHVRVAKILFTIRKRFKLLYIKNF